MEKKMTNIGKFNGNVNGNFLFGKKEAPVNNQKPEVKENVPVAGAKGENKNINLNEDPKAIYSTMGLNISKTTVDKEIAKYLDAKTLSYIQNTPAFQAKIIGETAIASYSKLEEADGNDPLENAIPGKYYPTAEQRARIGESVAKFESYFA